MRAVPPSASQASSQSWAMSAPVGGWNARDALCNMPPSDAIQLDNWFPNTTTVDVRPGYTNNATVTAGQSIKSLLGVARADGTYKRFAATQTGIWDITLGGAIPAVSSAATTGSWESVQINVGGVSYLWCCAGDGANKSRLYNGTADAWTVLDGASAPVLTGPSSANVSNVALWKYRLILTELNTLKFWYGPLNSVGGVFSSFDLGSIFKKGGYLVATSNWTLDAGDGADDRFVAVTSEGEVAVYQGTDPSSATTFQIVGVYQIGKPIGKRCFLQLAGDLAILTESGLVPLSKAIQSAVVNPSIALTDKIQSAFNSYYKQYGATFGWQAVFLPKGPAVLVNVPLSTALSYQFVMNTNTGAWCRFKNWSAACMLVLDGKLYYAIGNTVYEGWTTSADGSSAITAIAASAYSYGPTRMRSKKIKMVRPMLQVGSKVNIAVLINSDFANALNMTPDVSTPQGTSLWDSAVWGTSVWGLVTGTQRAWKAVRHRPSTAFSLQLGVQVKSVNVSWAQTDFLGEQAEVSLA